jgi:uncharacterized membrane protein
MSKKANKSRQNKISAKKAAVLGIQKKSRLPLAIAGMSVFAIAAAVVFFMTQSDDYTSKVSNHGVIIDNTSVIYPASLFEDGRARHFDHVSGEHTVRYFIIKSSDGILRAAFDACDVCWPAGKGYYQEGDHMVCRNCGRRFASVLVNEVQGGCNPAPLNRKLEDGKLVIQIKDIQQGKKYFDFDGKV